MSWIGGYKAKTSTTEDDREAKRKKLEADRELRAKQRERQRKQLESIAQTRKETKKVIQDFLDIDPEIFEGEAVEITDEEAAKILEDSLENVVVMADFDTENENDGEKAMEKLCTVQCPYNPNDLEFWFTELEGQLEIIEIKSQWSKRMALQKLLPLEVKEEVKTLLKITKANAGTDIYFRIKAELLDLFGKKPEDDYIRAKNRVLSGKPSQLGKALINDICTCQVKLQSGCCAKIIWVMYREALPVVIRNHIAELQFNKDTYRQIFQKSDQIFD